ELENADDAEVLIIGHGRTKYLNRSFFGELVKRFVELLGFQRIFQFHSDKVFRRKNGDAGKGKFFTFGKRIANAKHTRIMNTDNIASKCLVHQATILSHKLRWSAKTHFALGPNMKGFHPALEPT